MLLESSIKRTKSIGNSLKISESADITFSESHRDGKSRTMSTLGSEASANISAAFPTVVQCYSVSTGKVSTLLRSPSQSSISSIEVAEINHLSEFRNTIEQEQIAAHNSVPRCSIDRPTFVTAALVGEVFDVEKSNSSSLAEGSLICISNDCTKR